MVWLQREPHALSYGGSGSETFQKVAAANPDHPLVALVSLLLDSDELRHADSRGAALGDDAPDGVLGITHRHLNLIQGFRRLLGRLDCDLIRTHLCQLLLDMQLMNDRPAVSCSDEGDVVPDGLHLGESGCSLFEEALLLLLRTRRPNTALATVAQLYCVGRSITREASDLMLLHRPAILALLDRLPRRPGFDPESARYSILLWRPQREEEHSLQYQGLSPKLY